MSCTLRIKTADVEIDYSGEEAFAEKHFGPLLQKLEKSLEHIEPSTDKRSTDHAQAAKANQPNGHILTTSTAATKLGVKSGTDLALAAAYVLHRSGKETFSRSDLNKEMQTAKSYFKEVYRKNLTPSIATLVKGDKMLDQGSETYALSVDCKAELDKKFA